MEPHATTISHASEEARCIFLLHRSEVEPDPAAIDSDCCCWYDIECDPSTARVTGFAFFRWGINGTIPSAIGDLSHLTKPDLRKIPCLVGPIPPAIAKLTSLTLLSLDWNNLTGPVPSFLSRLTRLYYLNLSFNRLSGSIPASLADITLVFIRLDRNRLAGSIPTKLARSSATSLYLSHNDLTGAIPGSFAGSTGFQYLDFSRNRLSGSIPASLADMALLDFIRLDRNRLTDSISAKLARSSATSLYLSHNDLTGTIPGSFAGSTGFQYLDFSRNRLSGDATVLFGARKPLMTLDLLRNLFEFDFTDVVFLARELGRTPYMKAVVKRR